MHRVRLAPSPVDATALAAVFHNSATFAFAEIMGRSYGGGILELEPGEAEQLPIPPPEYASADLASDVDLLLKANEIEKALDVVDRQVLIDGLGWSPDVVAACRSAWTALRDRRTMRGIPVSLRESAIAILTDWQAPDAGPGLVAARRAGVRARPRRRLPARMRSRAMSPRQRWSSTTAAASVLLTLHPRLRRWVQLGGHCEDDDARHRRRGAARGDRGIRRDRAAHRTANWPPSTSTR